MSGALWSIVIATYRREQVLVDTIEALRRLDRRADEILIVDQSEAHGPAVAEALHGLERAGEIRLLRPGEPNIPAAMNLGLAHARGDFALFLDDDIEPSAALVEAHRAAQARSAAGLVAGRVIQPWEPSPSERRAAGYVDGFSGGNFSIDRRAALRIGGFDENFTRAAYRYEAEFAYRWRGSGGRIFYAPDAALRHLKFPSGGTRARGDHLRTAKPDHAVGEYYCLLRTWRGWRSAAAFAARPVKAIATRHHLRRPWWIPATLMGEATGAVLAAALALRGPKLTRPC